MIVLSSTPVGAALLAVPLENMAYSASQRGPNVAPVPRTAVVLGGGLRALTVDAPSSFGAYDLTSASDRVVAGVRLWREGRVDHLVFTGTAAPVPEAELMARFAVDLGAPRSAMLLEGASRNTRENARLTKELLQRHGLPLDIWLVTSSLHMPRALAVFRCAGFRPVAHPAESEMRGRLAFTWREIVPSPEALDLSRRALKEWIARPLQVCTEPLP